MACGFLHSILPEVVVHAGRPPKKTSGRAGFSSFLSTNFPGGVVFLPWDFANGKQILPTCLMTAPLFMSG
jgi:hypothetical protein